MLKLWHIDQLTPRPSQNLSSEKNPFDNQNKPANTPPRSPAGSVNNSISFHHHHLLKDFSPSSPHSRSSSLSISTTTTAGDLTPLAPGLTPPLNSHPNFAAALPTTSLSLHAPDFKMKQPPPARNTIALSSQHQLYTSQAVATSSNSSASSSSSSSSHNNHQQPSASTARGQLHVKLIQARALNVSSLHSRPHVVIQFENNEFVSREPIDEQEKEARGVAISRNNSSTALSALGAINSRAIEAAKRSKGSAGSSPQSSVSSRTAPAPVLAPSHSTNGIFGRMSAHNPVWKHEVSLSVSHRILSFASVLLTASLSTTATSPPTSLSLFSTYTIVQTRSMVSWVPWR